MYAELQELEHQRRETVDLLRRGSLWNVATARALVLRWYGGEGPAVLMGTVVYLNILFY